MLNPAESSPKGISLFSSYCFVVAPETLISSFASCVLFDEELLWTNSWFFVVCPVLLWSVPIAVTLALPVSNELWFLFSPSWFPKFSISSLEVLYEDRRLSLSPISLLRFLLRWNIPYELRLLTDAVADDWVWLKLAFSLMLCAALLKLFGLLWLLMPNRFFFRSCSFLRLAFSSSMFGPSFLNSNLPKNCSAKLSEMLKASVLFGNSCWVNSELVTLLCYWWIFELVSPVKWACNFYFSSISFRIKFSLAI